MVTNERPTSEWKFYEFLYVRFDVYQMTSPIGKAHNLPSHFTTGSNEKALVRFDGDRYNDYLCFWRCLTVHIINSLSDKPLRDYRWIETKVEKYFNQFYENQNNIKLYQGIKYIAYDKEYTEERCDANDYLYKAISPKWQRRGRWKANLE